MIVAIAGPVLAKNQPRLKAVLVVIQASASVNCFIPAGDHIVQAETSRRAQTSTVQEERKSKMRPRKQAISRFGESGETRRLLTGLQNLGLFPIILRIHTTMPPQKKFDDKILR
jgi:hypothetical protein